MPTIEPQDDYERRIIASVVFPEEFKQELITYRREHKEVCGDDISLISLQEQLWIEFNTDDGYRCESNGNSDDTLSEEKLWEYIFEEKLDRDLKGTGVKRKDSEAE